MTALAGPYTLALSTPLQVPVPAGDFTTVVLTNSSPYTCAVNIGGPAKWLNAFAEDAYDIPAGATVTVTPTIALAGTSTSNNVLLATFYTDTDDYQSAGPSSLTAQAVVASIQVDTEQLVDGRAHSIANNQIGTGQTSTQIIGAPPGGYVNRLGPICIVNATSNNPIEWTLTTTSAGNLASGQLTSNGTSVLLPAGIVVAAGQAITLTCSPTPSAGALICYSTFQQLPAL